MSFGECAVRTISESHLICSYCSWGCWVMQFGSVLFLLCCAAWPTVFHSLCVSTQLAACCQPEISPWTGTLVMADKSPKQ